MSYHDGYDPRREGISVVNPLIRIERKFDKITKLLANNEVLADLSVMDLKSVIEEILNE